jgi:RNA recognition motif-containing protein
LDWGCKERDLENTVYDTLGSNVRVVSVKILYDRETGRSKGFGFIG